MHAVSQRRAVVTWSNFESKALVESRRLCGAFVACLCKQPCEDNTTSDTSNRRAPHWSSMRKKQLSLAEGLLWLVKGQFFCIVVASMRAWLKLAGYPPVS